MQPTPLTTTESYSSVEASSGPQTTTSDSSELPCSEQPRRNPPRNRKAPEHFGEVLYAYVQNAQDNSYDIYWTLDDDDIFI